MKAGIIDYGAGNLKNVARALEQTGFIPKLIENPLALGSPEVLVLPGQGHFGQASSALTDSGLADLLRNWLGEGKPFLGICLGLQLLFGGSEEAPGTAGLARLSGTVTRLQEAKVPHMGWNTVETSPEHPFHSLLAGRHFYFVHSYMAPPLGGQGLTTYGNTIFTTLYVEEQLIACQFHPEKSGSAGLRFLEQVRSYLTARSPG